MEFASLSTTRTAHWDYVAEGGANLVVSYVGPVPSPFVGKVLRLLKCRRTSSSRLTAHHSTPPQGYSRKMMLELLGEDLVVDGTSIRVERSFLKRLEQKLAKDGTRPAERVLVDTIDIGAETVVVMDNLAHGDDFLMIEIKVS